MSESDSTQAKGSAYDKGDRAAILHGRSGVGVRGSIFWVGENKYGPGMRYGLRGDDGATYWVDEADLGPEDQAPAAPDKPKDDPPALERGDTALITAGPHAGHTGEVFWVGSSKFGAGWRYGVRGEGEDAIWVDGLHVRKQQSDAATIGPTTADQAPVYDDLPPEAHEVADGLPPEAYEDDGAAAEDDDLPF